MVIIGAFSSILLHHFSLMIFSASSKATATANKSIIKNGSCTNLLDEQKAMTFYNPNNEQSFEKKLLSFRQNLIEGLKPNDVIEITTKDNIGIEENPPPSEEQWYHLDCSVLGLSLNDRLKFVETIKNDERSNIIKLHDTITDKYLILKVYRGQPNHYSAEIAAFFALNHKRIVRPICTMTVIVNVSVPDAKGTKMPVTWPALLMEYVSGMNPCEFFFELGRYLQISSSSAKKEGGGMSQSPSLTSISPLASPPLSPLSSPSEMPTLLPLSPPALSSTGSTISINTIASMTTPPIATDIGTAITTDADTDTKTKTINTTPSPVTLSPSLTSIGSNENSNNNNNNNAATTDTTNPTIESQLRGLTMKIVPFIFAQMVAGILYMQSKGIVYQDLKPDNLIIDSEGMVTFVDFDCASYKLAQPGVGTFPFIAPEQIGLIRGELYFGVTWWQLAGTITVLLSNLLAGIYSARLEQPEQSKDEIDSKIVKKLRSYTPVHLDDNGGYTISNLPSQIATNPRQLLFLLTNEKTELRRFRTKASIEKLKKSYIFQGTKWRNVEGLASRHDQFPGMTPNQIVEFFLKHVEKTVTPTPLIKSKWREMSKYQIISISSIHSDESGDDNDHMESYEIEDVTTTIGANSKEEEGSSGIRMSIDSLAREDGSTSKTTFHDPIHDFLTKFVEKVTKKNLASPKTLKELMNFSTMRPSIFGDDEEEDDTKENKKEPPFAQRRRRSIERTKIRKGLNTQEKSRKGLEMPLLRREKSAPASMHL